MKGLMNDFDFQFTNDGDELIRAINEGFGAKITKSGHRGNISKEASFAKKVFELGLDKFEVGLWGIRFLGLNKNALNSEYNNIEKFPIRVNYFD